MRIEVVLLCPSCLKPIADGPACGFGGEKELAQIHRTCYKKTKKRKPKTHNT